MSSLVQTVKKIFVSLPAIKTLQAEHCIEADLDEKVKKYCANQKIFCVINANYQEINTTVNTVVNLVILLFCGKAILSGSMTIGTMMLISNVQSRTTMPLFFFNNYYLQYKSCFPGISRLVRFLDFDIEKAAVVNGKATFEKIESNNICYSYDDCRIVLENFSLEIKAREKIILIGDNMTGKSTLLKILAGLIKADSGSVVVDGRPMSVMELRNYVTLFLQNQESYSYFENTGSGGEIQLENLSLVKDMGTSLILLDEADSGINEKRLAQVYHFFAGEAAVILVTHRNVEQILTEYPNARVVDMASMIKRG